MPEQTYPEGERDALVTIAGMTGAFLIDRNVGRLVKWLRAFGFDTQFAEEGDDGELVRQAMREGRAIVTKDRKLLERRVITKGDVPAVLITADHLDDQLRQFFSVVPLLDARLLFSRCIRCNAVLCAVPKSDVREHVPSFVFEHHETFSRCLECGRVYWQGSHWEHMNSVLREAATVG